MQQQQQQQQQQHLQQHQQQTDRLAMSTGGIGPAFSPAGLRSGNGIPVPAGTNMAGTSAAASFFAR